jgi:hypothetical protein
MPHDCMNTLAETFMLKEVGASGQISLGKKYAGQLFEVETQADGTIVMRPMKVVPMTSSAQEERATYQVNVATTDTGDGWLAPERLARRAAAAARSPAEAQAARTQWEEENKDTIDAMNKRMANIGSMGMRAHTWRKAKALRDTAPAASTTDEIN